MAGIAGIEKGGVTTGVNQMLDKMVHRGRHGRSVVETVAGAWGAVWPKTQAAAFLKPELGVSDHTTEGHSAGVREAEGAFVLHRDPIGVAPLYYGRTGDGALCFASEVKALLTVTTDVKVLPPGHSYDGVQLIPYFNLKAKPALQTPEDQIAIKLRWRLHTSVKACVRGETTGAWLSGGLDSSAIVALARPHLGKMHTFVSGLPDAPDIRYAREAAEFLKTTHHEITVTLDDMLAALPDVIYHLESFDALLVRSSITNYLVSKVAADYVEEVLSGEGGDELFAGYEYLKALPAEKLPDELVDITGRLHNTALQRVDRSAAAHGLVAHVPFLHPDVVDYALAIPAELKIHNGVEKWILRQALSGLLPAAVLERPKAKFWQGTGLGELLAEHAAAQISDRDFQSERELPNRWRLNSKEELMYYRIFREHFGTCRSLDWMGRTKGAPVT